jgi:UDP:flavonoid glycosyltransferase YjiC (YdhE family)
VLTGLPIPSHLLPVLVPLAQAARAAGHEAAIATGAAMAAELERLGVPVVVLPGVLAPAIWRVAPNSSIRRCAK